MGQEGLRLNERSEVEDALKLEALRVAAEIGLVALHCGESRQFVHGGELANYLDEVATRILTQSAPTELAGSSVRP